MRSPPHTIITSTSPRRWPTLSPAPPSPPGPGLDLPLHGGAVQGHDTSACDSIAQQQGALRVCRVAGFKIIDVPKRTTTTDGAAASIPCAGPEFVSKVSHRHQIIPISVCNFDVCICQFVSVRARNHGVHTCSHILHSRHDLFDPFLRCLVSLIVSGLKIKGSVPLYFDLHDSLCRRFERDSGTGFRPCSHRP